MRKGYFQFKQFGIWHERAAMKVSTDAVVLGALAGAAGAYSTIFEVGVGTGVISLMLAQRFPQSKILGVEIDKDAFEEAQRNADESPFSDRLHFFHTSFQAYFFSASKGTVDLLVSNPPYFPDHLKSSDHKRNLALHADALSFEELLMGADHLLHEQGEFWVILPERQMAELIVRSKVFSFQLFSKVDLKDRSDKSVLRVICGFSKSKRIFFQNEITIRDDSGKFNSDYAALLMDFLLIF